MSREYVTTDDHGADRAEELARLLGEVIRVDEQAETITLTFRDGRRVSLSGLGYDGLWQFIAISSEAGG